MTKETEQFRPKFTTSVSAQEEAAENRSDYFGANVTTVHGSKPSPNVKPARTRFSAVQDRLAYDSAREAQQKEIEENTKKLKAAEKRRKKGHHHHAS